MGLHVVSTWPAGECRRCKARSGALTVWRVLPWSGPYAERSGATHVVSGSTLCADAAACEARRTKRADRARLRRSLIVVRDCEAPDAPRGTCRWCGGAIAREDGTPDRRRNYHHGPSSHYYGGTPRTGEPDCLRDSNHWRTWDPARALLLEAEDLGQLALTCADCPRVLARFRRGPRGAAHWDERNRWEADHEVPLEDGGGHSLENLRARCAPCHRVKTARENRERARRRREAASPQLALE